ncbi:hypothetical protein O6H91_05G075600 [Diphasiastrum complanatum]|uniref:Uncharacterized protein n=1 Tax=Diphasiastrum complanatum TaxID=34168 RepID=A0ACC2DPM8_DIPCM|nr:hypothetical protein O6H91_05G075600 [Diphasiastrum complanatum]
MALEAAADCKNAFDPDSKIADCGKGGVSDQLESQEKLISSGKEIVESKACIVGKQDNKYVCETHGKRFSSRQYMNVHLTNCGMQPLPKLKRGRKSIAAADLSLKDGQTRGIKDHFLENKLDLPKKKRRHAKTTGSGTEIILASKRGRKPHFTNSISSEIAGQDCVVEQYDDGYVCETHGLKYGSRHTINVHLMHCGMEPLPKLKRGRKSSTTPSESKRRRYEPSRSQEIAIATGTDMNEKSYNRSSPSASGCVSPPERLDAGLDSMPCSNLCIQKVDDFKKRKGCSWRFQDHDRRRSPVLWLMMMSMLLLKS